MSMPKGLKLGAKSARFDGDSKYGGPYESGDRDAEGRTISKIPVVLEASTPEAIEHLAKMLSYPDSAAFLLDAVSDKVSSRARGAIDVALRDAYKRARGIVPGKRGRKVEVTAESIDVASIFGARK